MSNYDMKIFACEIFFEDLARILKDTYEVIKSCNQDLSQYLIPNGTISDLSYYSKPERSFRISDHWNWYSNLRKCSDQHYIQCLSVDMPRADKRSEYGKATKPKYGIQVCILGGDGKYHAVYGEVYNCTTKRWDWLETDPADIAEMIA